MGCPGTGSGGSDFNPRSPQGERRRGTIPTKANQIFQSTLPARGATPLFADTAADWRISIHAPREGSDLWNTIGYGATFLISIHAPREGSDAGAVSAKIVIGNFNPRSPRGERPNTLRVNLSKHPFQSTLPARGATSLDYCLGTAAADFNPRSPRGERPDGGL